MLSKFTRAQLIIFGVIIALVLFFVFLFLGILPGLQEPTIRRANLELWGFEDEIMWKEFIINHKTAEVEGINVTYKKIDENQYESVLLNALAEGGGPDIFMFKDSQIMRHRNKIFPSGVPSGDTELDSIISREEFANTFVDGTHGCLIGQKGEILGVPLFLDTLALFYNKDLLNSANIPTPPKTWNDFTSFTEKMTSVTPFGDIEQSGAALGGAENIEYFVDIISALIFQSGGSIINYERNESVMKKGIQQKQGGSVKMIVPAESAMSFYTSFSNPQKKNYSWNRVRPNSIDAFSNGEVAMVIGFARDLPVIKVKNPHLNFGVSLFPQPEGADIIVNYGRFNILAVSRLSKNKSAAWKYILFAVSKKANADYLSAVGLPPARRDLADPSKNVPDNLKVFYRQSLSARAWLKPDENAVSAIFKDMVESLVSKKFSLSSVVIQANDRLSLLLKEIMQ